MAIYFRQGKLWGAILTYMLRLRRKESFFTSLCVFCGRASARKTHTNLYYNVWSPQATRLYEDIAPTAGKILKEMKYIVGNS